MGPGTTLDALLAELGDPLTWGPENKVVAASTLSTNRLARRVVKTYGDDYSVPPDFLVVAHTQSAGRGRLGRTWVSPAGCGLYATRVHVLAEPGRLPSLPLAVAVALAEAASEFLPAGRPCRLKWPNDLLVGSRKLGGILIETQGLAGGPTVALIGFGVNYCPPGADDALAMATSITGEGGTAGSLGRFTRRLVDAVDAALVDPAATAARYAGLSVHQPGDQVVVSRGGETLAGRFNGFDDAGFLRLATEAGGEVLVSSGEMLERVEGVSP